MLKDLEIILKEGASELGVSLNHKMMQMFLVYLKELKEWNQKVNLTSLKKDTAIISKHFIDSLSLVPYLPSKASLLDLGSGAGFPGIPVKIAKPSLKVTLIEAKRKKVNFQRHLVRKLGLTCIDSLQDRAESLTTENGSHLSFDIVTSRAFSRLEKFLMLGMPFVKKGGCLIAMKGKHAREELKDSQDVLKGLPLEVSRVEGLTLPFGGGRRYLIFMKKM
ncbi:MAG: 16S rRNA (guanine(527)-N(7))-methyltransferase RsmG [Deltaproteobacteria bacterium]|nr:16S rRNA (guanine(527)-N(7))-methyltransferase RsmG [Deltaproteobacteria bacterium]MBW2552580.1 16S rRNA (guanine(527)-N(7))-methyltransferase RsmG [Deltaproteobacteria bacterium]MCK5514860.1 16S rRNA (guanine(527)-N(7))-methyltransferase RsmG [Deltaproteobacteria bacterium]NOQ86415.1 16S rRNA (guanine(527)-N(7))-methyltransferase RsmG [Deltaproteobacteria bacterium]